MTDGEDEELKKLMKEAEGLGIDTSEFEEEPSYGYPEAERKENVFRFFRELLKFPKTWKVSNLTNAEIGTSKLGVRPLLELAQYARIEGLDRISNYFIGKANIVAEPTMSRKGFLPQLFVTQIKKEQKLKEPKPEKKGWFAKKTEEGEESGGQ